MVDEARKQSTIPLEPKGIDSKLGKENISNKCGSVPFPFVAVVEICLHGFGSVLLHTLILLPWYVDKRHLFLSFR